MLIKRLRRLTPDTPAGSDLPRAGSQLRGEYGQLIIVIDGEEFDGTLYQSN
jgi:hypothetical protein